MIRTLLGWRGQRRPSRGWTQMSSTGQRPFHRGIDRSAVLDAALELLDREGRQALTMRAVASALDVQAASLYTHIRSKEDLLGAVIDRVMEEVEVPPDTPSVMNRWRPSLTAGFLSYRRALVRHPAVVGLLTERSSTSPVRLALVARSITLLEAGGLTIAEAVATQVTLFSFTLGFVVQEVRPPSTPPSPDVLAGHPVMARAMAALSTITVDDRFSAGLDLIIDGAVRTRARRRPKPHSP